MRTLLGKIRKLVYGKISFAWTNIYSGFFFQFSHSFYLLEKYLSIFLWLLWLYHFYFKFFFFSLSCNNFHSVFHFSFNFFYSTTDIYRIMLSDKKYGLSVSVMATRVMPSLLPQTVNPSLNLEQFTILLEVGFKHHYHHFYDNEQHFYFLYYFLCGIMQNFQLIMLVGFFMLLFMVLQFLYIFLNIWFFFIFFVGFSMKAGRGF